MPNRVPGAQEREEGASAPTPDPRTIPPPPGALPGSDVPDPSEGGSEPPISGGTPTEPVGSSTGVAGIFDTRNLDNKLTRFPSPGPETGFSENFTAAADRFFNETSVGVQSSLRTQANDLREKLAERGVKVEPLVSRLVGEPTTTGPGPTRGSGRRGQSMENALQSMVEEARDKAEKQGVDVSDLPLSVEDLKAGVRQEFAQDKEEFNQTFARATTLGTAGSITGSLGGTMADPINLASLFFGAPIAGGILRTAAIEAGISGLTEAAIQPIVQSEKRSVGLNHPDSQVARNIALATAGGGVLGGAFGAVNRVLGRVDTVSRDVQRRVNDGDIETSSRLAGVARTFNEARDINIRDAGQPSQPGQQQFNRIVTDDLARFVRTDGGSSFQPEFRNVPLRSDALENLGRNLDGSPRVVARGTNSEFTDAGRKLGEAFVRNDLKPRANEERIRASRRTLRDEISSKTTSRSLAQSLRAIEGFRQQFIEGSARGERGLRVLRDQLRAAQEAGESTRGVQSAFTKRLEEAKDAIRNRPILRQRLDPDSVEAMIDGTDEFAALRSSLDQLAGRNIVRNPDGSIRSSANIERDIREELSKAEVEANAAARFANSGQQKNLADADNLKQQIEGFVRTFQNKDDILEAKKSQLRQIVDNEGRDTKLTVEKVDPKTGNTSTETVTAGKLLDDLDKDIERTQAIKACMSFRGAIGR